jgi:hypothetical protein
MEHPLSRTQVIANIESAASETLHLKRLEGNAHTLNPKPLNPKL